MKKKFFIFSILFLILSLNSCSKTQEEQKTTQKNFPLISAEDISKLNPEQIVILYFQAWNDKKYDIMYSLISDGFKQTDPTANTFEKFKSSMEELFNVASGVRVIDVKEASRDDKTAVVDFKIQIIGKDGSKQEISKTFTLKKRANGWKLIHPYGNNIDTT